MKNGDVIVTVENITMSVAEYIESKNRNLIFDTDVEEKVMAFDSDKIERIMLNLLSNAIKFTSPNDTITVTIQDKIDNIIIIVEDTGIGIPEDKLNTIFDRFIQVNKTFTREREGSGIGLSLVKSLVDMHNGKIYVESVEGAGSKFIIELPVQLVYEDEDYGVQLEPNLDGQIERINVEFSDIYS
jgi:signal transduction histidine kinase